VGPGRPFSLPSTAAAQPGDVIRIAPATYEDCAVLRADRVVIEGEDFARTTINNPICNGKAGFVITGNDATARGITPSAPAAPPASVRRASISPSIACTS
jgi:hypothetical protein